MPQTDQQSDFESRLKRRMRGDEPALDGQTRSRLTQARYAALAELEKPAWLALARGNRWLPAGGAFAAAVAVALLLRQGALPSAIPGLAPVEDIEILLSGEDLELYEDLEFYEWLDLQPEVG